MIRALDLSDRREALAILRLQKVSYEVEAGLIGSRDIPALRDTLRDLRRSGETFLGYFSRDELLGAISFKKESAILDIHRLVARPDHFRRGIGRSLVAHVEANAENAEKIIVSTGTRNLPATRLYRGLGFEEAEEFEALPGLRITRFEKQLRSVGPQHV